jgi:methylaspartate ammonia-lyase
MAAKILTQGRQSAPIQCKSSSQRATNVQPDIAREVQVLPKARVLFSPIDTSTQHELVTVKKE